MPQTPNKLKNSKTMTSFDKDTREAKSDPPSRPEGAATSFETKTNPRKPPWPQLFLDLQLFQAASEKSLDEAAVWIERGAKGTTRDATQRTALRLAAERADEAMIRLLLPVSDANASCVHGWTPLIAAAANGSVDLVEILLPVSDARQADNYGITALMRAAQADSVECMRRLVPASDPSAVDKSGKTLLMWAATGTRGAGALQEVLPLSDTAARDENGRTALIVAAVAGMSAPIVRALAAVSDARAVDNEGKSALAHAQDFANQQVVKVLTEALAAQERRELAAEVKTAAQAGKDAPIRRPKAL
jgi:ankyrin repeat protein